jgi:S1-C subfamily serine protease/Flp pilus assembly protein TadD
MFPLKKFLLPLAKALAIAACIPMVALAAGEAAPQLSPGPAGAITNPNATLGPLISPSVAGFDVKKLAAIARPAVALVEVFDKEGKLIKTGTGFFVSADGKFVTNAHVIEGATKATAKLENGASFTLTGVIKAAAEKDLLLLRADAKDVRYLPINAHGMPDVGTSVAVVGSPLGLEGSVSTGIISGQRAAKKDDQWLQMTARVSPGSSGSPVLDPEGNVVGVATFIVDKAQSLNFARPTDYLLELLKESNSDAEPAPLWTVARNPKNVILNDPDFIAAEDALQKSDAAKSLKLLNGLESKYAENELYLFKVGAVLDKLNLTEQAVETYRRALKLDPTNGMGWTNLGLSLTKLNKVKDARDAANQAVRLAPDFGSAWVLLGLAYSQENRNAEAADAFQKAANLTPNEPEIWHSLSVSYAKLNDTLRSQQAAAKWQSLSALNTAPNSSQTQATISAPTATRPSSRGIDDYKEFVTSTLRAFEENRPDVVISKYADRVNYRDYGVQTHEFIQRDLTEYFQRWPMTKTRLRGDIKVENVRGPDEKRVWFSYDFRAASPDRRSFSSGIAETAWWVYDAPDGLKIFAERQRVNKTLKKD